MSIVEFPYGDGSDSVDLDQTLVEIKQESVDSPKCKVCNCLGPSLYKDPRHHDNYFLFWVYIDYGSKRV